MYSPRINENGHIYLCFDELLVAESPIRVNGEMQKHFIMTLFRLGARTWVDFENQHANHNPFIWIEIPTIVAWRIWLLQVNFNALSIFLYGIVADVVEWNDTRQTNQRKEGWNASFH